MSPLYFMRIFTELSPQEQKYAMQYCHNIVCELLLEGVILAEGNLLIGDLAEAMALDAEYPSQNEDGTYKKVIQL